jgi:putative flippase GtrA
MSAPRPQFSGLSLQKDREWGTGHPRPGDEVLSSSGHPRPPIIGGFGIARELTQGNPSGPSEVRRSFFRWLKFNVVGGFGIVVQLSVLTIFRSLLDLNYLLATALAVETAVLHNFLWHERFTWSDRPSGRLAESLSRLLRFNATNGLLSILGNLLLMHLLAGMLGMPYLAANLISIAACSLANFLLSDRFVFCRVPRPSQRWPSAT